jgi:hypothetical protein
MAFRCTAQRYDYFLNNNKKSVFLIDILAKYQEKAVKKESIWPKRPSANDTKNVIGPHLRCQRYQTPCS